MAERNAGMKAAVLMCGLIVVGLILATSAAGVAATPAPTQHNVTTPTPVPTPTPGPTPIPRQVFSDPRWDGDRISILVANNGAPVTIVAYLNDPMNNITYSIDTGVTKRVQTPKATATGGMVDYGFKAYEKGSVIQAYENSIQVSVSPTPPPESAIVSGTILDAQTNLPINGAEVIFTSETFDKQYPSAYTDSSGTFVTGKMYPDTYLVTIKASGYQTLTAMRTAPLASGAQKLSDQKLTLIAGSSPTPTPTPMPSATPGSPLDAWMNLLYSPQTCCGTLAVALGAIVSATAIYEWTMRQRERRKQKEAKDRAEGKIPEEKKESK